MAEKSNWRFFGHRIRKSCRLQAVSGIAEHSNNALDLLDMVRGVLQLGIDLHQSVLTAFQQDCRRQVMTTEIFRGSMLTVNTIHQSLEHLRKGSALWVLETGTGLETGLKRRWYCDAKFLQQIRIFPQDLAKFQDFDLV